MSKKRRTREAHAQLDAIYARLPRIDCRGLCAGSCGAIILTATEAERMKQAHPDRRALKTCPIMCSYLTPRNRCAVYRARPLICRVWGLVKRMSCPHGCVPDRWLSDHEFVELAAAMEAFAGPLSISTPNGLEPLGKSFLELRARIRSAGAMPPELAEVYADKTLTARALNGGRIVGIVPREEDAWIECDEISGGHRD
jgi:Fe-S-cluster containining protein